jgi:hypothetical protein
MAMTKQERAASAKLRKDNLHAQKLHVIAERRAKAAKLDKADFIAEIVKGNYRPITAEDIAAEPNPE